MTKVVSARPEPQMIHFHMQPVNLDLGVQSDDPQNDLGVS
jgi:hypothetical protein